MSKNNAKTQANEPKDAKPIKETKCPITKEYFRENAPKKVTVVIDGREYDAHIKEFSTGSFGWSISEKKDVKVGEHEVKSQITFNLTVVGSKDAPAK